MRPASPLSNVCGSLRAPFAEPRLLSQHRLLAAVSSVVFDSILPADLLVAYDTAVANPVNGLEIITAVA
jgi:hypothetical protein